MKKVIIFGATGNIGAYFVDYCIHHLDAAGYEVVAVGRRRTDYFEKMGIRYIMVDLCKNDDFASLPCDDIYAVVNLAGVLPAYTNAYDPFEYVNTNVAGALRILEYAKRNHADRVLYTQTWADLAGYWGKETVLHPNMARSLVFTGDHAFYAITKCMIVDTMEHYKQEYGVKNFVFRLPNVYMYHPDKYYYVNLHRHLVAYRYLIERAVRGEDIEIWGNPDAFKDILYVKDLCQMMFRALFANVNGGMYNAGTGIKTTLREQLQGMVDVFSSCEKKSVLIERPEKPSFPSFVMDIENARSELGYQPEYSYKKYLEDYKREEELMRFNKLWIQKAFAK